MSTNRQPRLYLEDPRDPLIGAVSLALAWMTAAGASTWAELCAEPAPPGRALIRVTAEQAELTAAHSGPLTLLRVRPLVTLAVCRGCGGFEAASGGQGPRECLFSGHCPGPVVKAVKAVPWLEPSPASAERAARTMVRASGNGWGADRELIDRSVWPQPYLDLVDRFADHLMVALAPKDDQAA